MGILCGSGIVGSRKEGKWMHYSICDDGIRYAADLLMRLTEKQTGHGDERCCGTEGAVTETEGK
jgi:ArsR family transcriptional regulator